jgi:hypothetical protein
MQTEIIKEGVLNDDMLHIADENKIFKGGYKAILEHYTFQNSWSNRKHLKRFKTLENAYKFIDKTYNTESNLID